MLEDNLLCCQIFPVEILVRFIIDSQSRTLERYTGKKSTGARVREDLRPHGNVRFGGSVTSHRTSGSGGICAELYLAGEDCVGRSRAHQQQDEVGRLCTNLQTEASTLERHHCGLLFGAPVANRV